MKNRNIIIFVNTAGWIASALGIIGVAIGSLPLESRSPAFWQRILWTEFLNFIVWSAIASYNITSINKKDENKTLGGVIPAFVGVIIAYSVLSFVVLLIHAFLNTADAGDRIHLVIQICLAVMATIILVFLSVAKSHAGVGLERTFEPGLSPHDLADLIAEQEARVRIFPTHDIWNRIGRTLKNLRESIKYSLPDVGDVGQKSYYREFSKTVASVCNELSSLNDPSDQGLSRIQSKLDDLTIRVKTLSSKSIRR
jgi:hypothetical protein